MTPYQLLIEKLQDFIKKYYLQKLMYGILMMGLILLPLFLVSSTLEYNLYLSGGVRAAMFWIWILVLLWALYFYIIKPLYHYFYTQHRLDYKKASVIIGAHFPEVKDKLLNVLQLNELKTSVAESELINAAIEQKINGLKWVQFTKAIDWDKNKKLLKYISIPLLIILLMLLFFPSFIQESTHRIIHYDQHFEPKAPFDFKLLNSNLKVVEYGDLEIQAQFAGKSLPNEMNLYFGGKYFPMKKDKNGTFRGDLKYISEERTFQLEGGGYKSQVYEVKVVPKPIVSAFELTIMPPSYTGQKSFSQKDNGDISAPEGSTIIWKFETKSVDDIQFIFPASTVSAQKFANGFGLKRALKNITSYAVVIGNKEVLKKDTMRFAVNMLPDQAPSIFVKEFKDSARNLNYYAGDIADDYGFTKLQLAVEYEANGKRYTLRYNLPLQGNKNQSFQTPLQPYLEKIPVGTKASYYFEVFDNDVVNGFKSSRSELFSLYKPTLEQQSKAVDAKTNAIKSDLSGALKEAKDLQKDIESLRKKMLEKKQMDWNDKQQLENLLKKQKELQEKIKETQQELKENFEKKNELTQQDKDILEKQKQLEELIKQVSSPEMNEMLKKMQEMMEQMDKKDLLNQLEKMDDKSEKLEKELDRMLNLYKNLDYQQKMKDAQDKLDKMAADQERLSKESEQNINNTEKQKELNQKMDEAKEDLKKLENLSKELKKPGEEKAFDEIEKDLNEAEKEQDEAKEELEKNDKKDAAKKQKKASDKIKEASEKLKKASKKQKKQQKKEDAATMRRLLENLMYLSFAQEKLVENTKTTNIQSPTYPKVIQDQKKIKDDFGMIEDSLYKLASRQNVVKKIIFEEVEKINGFTKRSINFLTERQVPNAIPQEQFAMTSFNNLALMISESLRKMNENDDDDDSDSDQSCDNPKKSKKKKPASAKKLAEMQQDLNQQLENLKKQMEGKENPGGSMPNKMSGGKDGMSQQMAKIAAQQAAIRNALKELENKANQPGKDGKKPLGEGLGDVIQKMEQTEKEIVNKKVYNEMLKRQKEIEIKLLEAAKAEREQDEENKRESQSTKDIPAPIPADLKKYLEQKKENENNLKKNPVGLTPFYKSLVEKYFEMLK